MWNMPEVSQQKLQGVLSRCQLYGGFGLTLAEVDVLRIGWNRNVQGWQRVNIHQQVMVTGRWQVASGRGDTHSPQPETHRDRTADGFSICRRNDVELSADSRWATIQPGRQCR